MMMAMLAGAALGGGRVVTPSPTPNWANITGSVGAGGAVNANVTIQGITEPITLRVNVVSGFADTTLKYRINSGTYTTIADEGTFTVSANDTVNFQGISITDPETSSFQVINQTDANAVLDTITVTLS